MSEIPVKNNGKNDMHIGGKLIPPGETRMVDEKTFFKQRTEPAPESDPATEAMLALLDGSVSDIEKALPSLSLDELDALERAEQNGKTRKTLIEAITEERLSRASQAQEVAEFVSLLASMSEEELMEQLDVYEGDEGMLALVNAEIEKRSQ